MTFVPSQATSPLTSPEVETIEFGYPDRLDRVPARSMRRRSNASIRKRLDKEVIDVSIEYLRRKRGY